MNYANAVSVMKDTENVRLAIEGLFPVGAIRTLQEVKVEFASSPVDFKENVLTFTASLILQEVHNDVVKNRLQAASFRTKAEDILFHKSLRVPEEWLDEIKIGGKAMKEETYYNRLLQAASEAEEKAEDGDKVLDILRDFLRGKTIDTSLPVRVFSRAVLGVKNAFSMKDIPLFEQAVAIAGKYGREHVNAIGVDTRTAEYQEMKKAVEGFISLFNLPEGNGYKKVYVNLNKEEVMWLAVKIFASGRFRFVRDKEAKTVTVEITSGASEVERQFLNAVIFKWSGRRIVKDGVECLNII